MSAVAKLSSFSTCEISDALIKLGIPHGGLIPDIRMLSPPPANTTSICAPAYTVQMVTAASEGPKLSSHFVDTVPQGSVIVIDAPHRSVIPLLQSLSASSNSRFFPLSYGPDVKNAVWGGLMTAGALARGAVGVIISGRCRDIAEHRAAHFPVFARGNSTVGQSPFTRPSAVNIPLLISPQAYPGESDEHGAFPPVTVRPGDWMIADDDGVVCVPSEMKDDVARLAAEGREVDSRCLVDIRAGMGVQASFKKHRGK